MDDLRDRHTAVKVRFGTNNEPNVQTGAVFWGAHAIDDKPVFDLHRFCRESEGANLVPQDER